MAKENPKLHGLDDPTLIPPLPLNDTADTPPIDQLHWSPVFGSVNGSHPTVSPSNSTPDDGFDLNSLRLSQDFTVAIGVQKRLTTVPVRKPHKQEFIRVHPDESWRLQTAAVDMQEDREVSLDVHFVNPVPVCFGRDKG
jgi:hypothetical protein